jgi:endo-1,4-beta-xylanase
MTASPPPSSRGMTRRSALATPLALCACDRENGTARAQDRGPPPALRLLADVPVGVALSTAETDQPDLGAQAGLHFSQLTPSWQMKMEYILQADGTFRFDAPDALAAFAAQNRMRLFGHTLVWYGENPVALKRLDGDAVRFRLAVSNYIAAVAGRYAGQAVAWDVVNEAVRDDGSGLRDCIYSRNMGGEAYIAEAFHLAREADPHATLLLNDYDLEITPAKRRAFMALVERLLAQGAPIGGIGCQSHIGVGLEPGASRTAVMELASLGLPIHVSELDVSLHGRRFALLSPAQKLQRQADRYAEVADAFMNLPPRQRFAFTVWGLRDSDSWLLRDDPADAPLLFDRAGEPKPAFWAVADRLKQG